MAGPGERACSHVGSTARGRECQKFRQPSAPFGVMALHVPDVGQYHCHAKPILRVALPDRPEQRRPQIVLFLKCILSVPRVVHTWGLNVSSQLQAPGQVTLTDRAKLAGITEALQRVLADRFQETEPHLLRTLIVDKHQGFIEELLQQSKDVICLDAVAACNLLRCSQRPSSAEDGEPTQEHSLRIRQELIAPVERRAKGLVPARRRSTPANQQLEAIVETGRKLLRAQQLQTGSRQLDGEWDTVQSATDLRDNCEVWLRYSKVGCGRGR